MQRRDFLTTAGAIAASGIAAANAQPGAAASAAEAANRGKIYKSVKWVMIKIDGPALARFEVCKELGFDGMELVSPDGPTVHEARAAAQQAGMPVHGVVDMRHWRVRLSSPDPATREKGRAFLEQAIADTHAYGGDAVLLVPGLVRGDDENHQMVWDRSIEQIRLALPIASRMGVRILIENVWNGFCKQPQELRDYVDAINSPWVGVYFDIGNAQKFAPSEEWIRTLGSRIVKLDIKDWGEQSGFCKIGDGDVNWPAVREALAEIGFTGWCTAEVVGGDRDRLADIAARMDRVLQL